jgi:hypothetical protein
MAIYKLTSDEQSIAGIIPPNPYFYFSLTSVESTSGSNYSIKKIVVDSNKNIIVLYQRNDSNGSAVAKYDQYGTLTWAYGYKDAQSYYDVSGMEVDSSGNIYVSGSTYQSYYSRPHFFKLDSSGSILLQKQYGAGNASEGGVGNSITVDASGNIYLVGSAIYSDTDSRPYIAKYNSSGTKTWDYRYDGVSVAGFFYNVKVDNAGNIWATGTSYASSNAETNAFVVKLNSSGTELFQRTLSEGTTQPQTINANSMVIDSSDNVYFSVYSRPSTGALQYGILVKLNSSGTLQWQRKVFSSSNDTASRSVQIASDGNILSIYNSSGYGIGLMVHNSSGTLQWQKRLIMKNGNLSTGIEAFTIDSFSNMYFGISTSGLSASSFTENGLIKIPYSSSATYSSSLLKMSMQYIAGSFSEDVGALTNTTSTITRSSSIPLTASNASSAVYTINNSISKVAL